MTTERAMSNLGEAITGKRFRLVKMGDDDPDPITPGATGVIDSAVSIQGSLHLNVTWDEWVGRSLNLSLPADKIEIIGEGSKPVLTAVPDNWRG